MISSVHGVGRVGPDGGAGRGWAGIPWGPAAAQRMVQSGLRGCSCDLSSQRKPDLVGFGEIYQGWQGNPGMEALESRGAGGRWSRLIPKKSWGGTGSGPEALQRRDWLRSGIVCINGFASPSCSTALDLKAAMEMERLSMKASWYSGRNVTQQIKKNSESSHQPIRRQQRNELKVSLTESC